MGRINKLKRLKSHMVFNESSEQTVTSQTTHHTVPHLDTWKLMGASPRFYEDQYMIVREVTYPLTYKHGRYLLSDFLTVCHKWKEKGMDHHPLSIGKHAPSNLLFFDTETTGLSTGAGTTIFLIGAATIEDDQVKLRQYFLPGPEHEVAFYYHFLHDQEALDQLVTYNGKAFDWPHVKTRHTFVRNHVPNLPPFGHYDLLHLARRIFRHRLSSCKLSIVEKEVLDFTRHEDTPGYLAPMLYFDFLNETDPSLVEGVFRHNEWDVLSLITLYIDLSYRIFSGGKNIGERLEIARLWEHIGAYDEAMQQYKTFYQRDDRFAIESAFRLGALYKKKGQWRQALSFFKHVVKNQSIYEIDAAIELAKLYEHKIKNFEQAHFFATYAFKRHKEKKGWLGKKEEKVDFRKRIDRLERKLRAEIGEVKRK